MSIENDPRLANSTTGIYLQKTFNIEPRTPRCFPGVNKPKTYSERLRMGLDCDEVYPGIIIGKQINTVSAILQPRGSIFQYGFLGGGQYKKIPQKVDFLNNKWGFIQDYPQKLDFSHYLGL